MLTIRRKQIDHLSDWQSGLFLERLLDFLRAEFKDAASEPRDSLRPAVAAQVEKGQRYGLETEQQLTTYTICAWLLGENFDTEYPAAEEMLTSGYSAEDKAEWLSTAFHKYTDIFHSLRRSVGWVQHHRAHHLSAPEKRWAR